MHRRDPQPWGHVERLEEGVKRIVIDPEDAIAPCRQMHQTAHWIVLKGAANTIVAGIQRTVREGGSFHVPRATMYQLSNLGKVPLEIIEVRTDADSAEDNVLGCKGTRALPAKVARLWR